MLLKEVLAENSWEIAISPSNGHCMLHSVVSSFRSQLPGNPMPTLSSLCNDIIEYMNDNFNDFTLYGFSRESLTSQVNKYVFNRDFVIFAIWHRVSLPTFSISP